ncbi:hypothetical protein KFE25_010052 [Diacronema lutheri]|uniref:Uncharacterized protein n=1 Tax=Diacronema lutheri TaxID=2081491 RepID=A0A8J5XJW3_DIALT|nr:hypothetical protein KFE25_010052 [Diacronema lutheri]
MAAVRGVRARRGGIVCARAAGRGTTAVFLATDAPALDRFAMRPGALGGASNARLLTLEGSGAIAPTNQRPRAVRLRMTAETVRAVHARGAADW